MGQGAKPSHVLTMRCRFLCEGSRPALRRMAARELAANRDSLTRSLKAVEAKLQAQRRVGPIPVSAHVHQGGATAQCVRLSALLVADSVCCMTLRGCVLTIASA